MREWWDLVLRSGRFGFKCAMLGLIVMGIYAAYMNRGCP